MKATEKYNEPGRFTAFHGYEWTSMPGGDNLHRNVVFRDGADKALQTLPFSALDSENPEDLWKVLAAYEEKTGGRVLAIPHNPNISGGRMFALVDATGNPFTATYAEARARWRAPGGRADQGPKRIGAIPLAHGRICQLRTLGQDEPRGLKTAPGRVFQV